MQDFVLFLWHLRKRRLNLSDICSDDISIAVISNINDKTEQAARAIYNGSIIEDEPAETPVNSMDGTEKAVNFALNFEPTLPYIRDEIKKNNLLGSRITDRGVEKVANEILSYTEKYQFGEAEIINYVKGESIKKNDSLPIFSDFKIFLKKNGIYVSGSQSKGLHDLIHQCLMYSLTPVQIFLYIEKSFPMFSNIKDMLLQRRNGSDQLQCSLIRIACPKHSLFKYSKTLFFVINCKEKCVAKHDTLKMNEFASSQAI